MKIFLISNMFPSEKDSLFGVFIQNSKTELENNGASFPITALIKGKTKTKWKKFINYGIHYMKIIGKSLKSSQYDLIYIHFLSHHIPVLFFLILLRKPIVINLHGSDLTIIKNSTLLTFLCKPILRKVNVVVVPTSYFKDLVKKHFSFIKDDKIVISPSGGINKKVFYKKERAEKINSSQIILGFVSRFIEEKGWRTYLDSLKILKDTRIPFKGIIAGKGPDESEIQKYISKLKLNSDIDFLGLVEQMKLVNIYNEMDLYIFPTYREAESLGLTGLEAMACGVPIIACDIAGPSTYVVSSKNGFLFPPKDSLGLADSIKTFYQLSLDKKLKMSEMAILTSKKYDQTQIALQLIKALKDKIQ